MKPIDATHVWVPGDKQPILYGVFQRRYYKWVEDRWFSFNRWGEWAESRNDRKWFTKEIIEGFFIPVEQLKEKDV